MKESVATTTCWGLSRLQQLYFYTKPEASSPYFWQLLNEINSWLMEAAPCKDPAASSEDSEASTGAGTGSSRYPDVNADRAARRRWAEEEREKERERVRGSSSGGKSKRAWRRFLRRVHGGVVWGGVLLVLVKPFAPWTLPGVGALLLLDLWSPSPELILMLAGEVAARGPIGALVSSAGGGGGGLV
jgi:hypothetical protein